MSPSSIDILLDRGWASQHRPARAEGYASNGRRYAATAVARMIAS